MFRKIVAIVVFLLVVLGAGATFAAAAAFECGQVPEADRYFINPDPDEPEAPDEDEDDEDED
ncbi:MAG: hypothetical protein M0036_18995 [Desulfobacteraceae bacterium]|nr:hypothetical protein [Desulfobacteraceae bacterium]